ncbi:MAG TPA: metallopeptidase family protein [Jatrophihabitans sp.]|jgi:predicted Zn-dependent protease with MMP-like domain
MTSSDIRRPGARRRERRGRGLRGILAPGSVPISATRSDRFDALVLSAVDHLRPHLARELDGVEFAVEDVPTAEHRTLEDYNYDDDVLDDNAVPLSRLYRTGVVGISGPVVVIYRRPLESRAKHPEELADLIHDVVVEQVARLLGRSPDEIDPPLE